MANPTPARYTVQLGPTVTPETAAELGAWAEFEERSVSAIVRECIERGLPLLRKTWERKYGAIDEAVLARHLEAARGRGKAQVDRRRDYDSRTRGAAKDDGAADDGAVLGVGSTQAV